MTAVLGLVAAVFQALGYVLYVRLFLRRVIRPNAASSFMFAYGTALLVLLEWKDGAGWEILALPITCSLASIGVALLCLRKGATEPVDRIEAIAFFADVWLTLLWAVIAFGYGNIAPFSTGFLIAGNVTTLTAFFPVLRSTWRTPERERPAPWLVWTLAYATMALVTALVDQGRNPALMIYPLLSVLLHGTVATLSLRAAGALRLGSAKAGTRRYWTDQAKTIYIAPSRIDGLGMFAGRRFEPGEAICQMTGRTIFGAITEDGPNWIGLGPDVWIDPEGPLDRINHCCAPNAAFGRHRQLRALRAIDPGEEVTIDYSTTEADPSWSMRCHCDAPDCRKTLYAIQHSFAGQPEPPVASPLMQLVWRQRRPQQPPVEGVPAELVADPLPAPARGALALARLARRRAARPGSGNSTRRPVPWSRRHG